MLTANSKPHPNALAFHQASHHPQRPAQLDGSRQIAHAQPAPLAKVGVALLPQHRRKVANCSNGSFVRLVTGRDGLEGLVRRQAQQEGRKDGNRAFTFIVPSDRPCRADRQSCRTHTSRSTS